MNSSRCSCQVRGTRETTVANVCVWFDALRRTCVQFGGCVRAFASDSSLMPHSANANVPTLRPSDETKLAASVTRAQIANLMDEPGIHVAGLQETHSHCNGFRKFGRHLTNSSRADARSFGGRELWLREDVPDDILLHANLQADDPSTVTDTTCNLCDRKHPLVNRKRRHNRSRPTPLPSRFLSCSFPSPSSTGEIHHTVGVKESVL